MRPKILLYDIETAPVLGYSWGVYQTDVFHIVEDWYMLSFAYKWWGDDEIRFERKSKQKGNDRVLVTKLWELFDEADIVVAHNGDRFDQKKTWARFLKWGLKPPSSYQSIDTLKVARKHFNLTSNKLDEVAKFLGVGTKLPHQGKHTWLGCIAEDEDAWAVMEEYNKQDVKLLSDVFDKLAPYAQQVPNMQQWAGAYRCTSVTCGSDRMVRRGYRRTHAAVYQQWCCKDCGHWSYELLRNEGVMR